MQVLNLSEIRKQKTPTDVPHRHTESQSPDFSFQSYSETFLFSCVIFGHSLSVCGCPVTRRQPISMWLPVFGLFEGMVIVVIPYWKFELQKKNLLNFFCYVIQLKPLSLTCASILPPPLLTWCVSKFPYCIVFVWSYYNLNNPELIPILYVSVIFVSI